jgi:hypothetical protein
MPLHHSLHKDRPMRQTRFATLSLLVLAAPAFAQTASTLDKV